MVQKVLTLMSVAVAFGALAVPAQASEPVAHDVHMTLTNFCHEMPGCLDDESFTAAAGDSVTFHYSDWYSPITTSGSYYHAVTVTRPDGSSSGSGAMPFFSYSTSPNLSWTTSLDQVGTYEMWCTVHPYDMRAWIAVS